MTTSPAVDLVDLERLLADHHAETGVDRIGGSLALGNWLTLNGPALISELTELRASRLLMEEAVGALSGLIKHADAMEAQNQDYHQPEGPLRSQPLCEAIQALTTIKEKTT